MSAYDPTGQVAAAAAGRVAAVAMEIQRDLLRFGTRYPELCPSGTFDGPLLAAIALANAFAAPRLDAGAQRPVTRAALWTFALDRLVDGQGATAASVAELARRCLEAAATPGRPETEDLLAMLGEIRDELAVAPGGPVLLGVWRAELCRTLRAMTREREWLEDELPDPNAYLANSDSLAFAFVLATLAASTSPPQGLIGLGRLRRAARVAQQALRLVNDLATYARDVHVGDLNVLTLGLSRQQARDRIAALSSQCRSQVADLPGPVRQLGEVVLRHLDYNMAFYAGSDYWGDPG